MNSGVSLIASHSMTDSEDDGCQLGRLEHWEAQYATELANLDHLADEGEVWWGYGDLLAEGSRAATLRCWSHEARPLQNMCRFGEDVQQQMVHFVAAVTKAQGLDPGTAAVLDVGTGNGILLAELAQLGFGNLTGSDYSPASISLAAAVMQRRGLSHVTLLVSGLLQLLWLPAPWLCSPPSALRCARCRLTASQTARYSLAGRLCWGPRSIVWMLKRPGSSLCDPAALMSSQTKAPLMPSASRSTQKPTGESCPYHFL